ncbi:hypothetical protein D9758_015784 [Tetrapyrgos nigripes]|uniref:Enoyl reductase (ER) domain-containing protein n=1 Tax=Tetrapyrgos nigripes TaxID=182062 RepID=A0A8H5C3W7_9AGAR|nr:hypothetical protein D9758_015784 [Tetrapyrgos nigripes]
MAVPKTMQRYILTSMDESFQGLTLQENVPVPAPAPGQVLVKVHALTLNARDVQIATNTYPNPAQPKKDVIPVSDASLSVIAIGPPLPDGEPIKWKIGDRVLPNFTPGFHAGKINHKVVSAPTYGGGRDGFLCEYQVVAAEDLVSIPSYLTDEEACTLPIAALTAYNCLYGYEPLLKAGDTVLLLGTGGCSIAGLQMALAAGCTTICTSSSDSKLARCKELGAHHLINYRATPEWEKEVRKITGGRGVDHVIEIGGKDSEFIVPTPASTVSYIGSALPKSIASCKMGGVVSIIGYLSDYNDKRSDSQGDYDVAKSILFAGCTVRGVFVGSREQFEDMNRLYEVKKIRPPIDKVYSFEQAKEAFHYVAKGSHFNKVVIKMQ